MHILKIALHENNKNYIKAVEYSKKLITFLNKNKLLFSKDRYGFAMGNLSIMNVYLGNFKIAAENARKAQEFHLQNSLHIWALKEQEFFANFYGQSYLSASNCIDKMIKHTVIDIGAFRKGKLIYYNTCVLFKKRQYKDALLSLTESLEIEKDKKSWNISLRILLIMIYIELNKKKQAQTLLSALKNHIQRTSKTKEITQRYILIVKLLHELEKDNFIRNEKSKKTVQLLAELSDQNKPASWNYYTPELIPFHEWVLSLPSKN